jgi:hypothetical protein
VRPSDGLLFAPVETVAAAAGIGPSGPPVAAAGLALLHSDSSFERREVGSFTLRVPENGNVVKLTRVAESRGGSKPRNKRGGIHGLSQAAGLRLRRSMLAVDELRVESPFFVTNTIVAGEFGWPEVRRFLKVYRARFERRWPCVAAYWVKELTRRGTPHLHFVIPWPVGGAPSLSEFKAWNDDAWASVVKSEAPTWHGGRYACRVELLRSWQGATSYLSCYLSEDSSEDPRQSFSGKMWGIIGKKHLPVRWLPEIVLTPDEGKRVQRVLRKLQQRKRTYWLHSSRSRDSVSSRGRPFKWIRIRPGRIKTFEDIELEGLEHHLRVLRSFGFSVKRVRPTCMRCVKVPLWSMDERTRRMELHGEQLHSFSSGWHHLAAAQALRLADFVKEESGRLTICG